MKKQFKSLRELFSLFALSIVLALLFAPLPLICVEVIMCLDLCFAVFILFITHKKKEIDLIKFLHLIQFFCVLTCSASVLTTRSFLSITDIEDQIRIIVVIGKWICNENCVKGFFTTILICFIILDFCSRHIQRANDVFEMKRHKIEDDLYEEIQRKVMEGEISEQEASEQRNKYYDDYYNNKYNSVRLVSVGKILTDSIKAFISLYIITVAGGTTLGIIELKLPWEEALDQYIMLSTGYLVFFIVPFLLASLSFRTKSEIFF